MDPGRILIFRIATLALAGLALSGCATLRDVIGRGPDPAMPVATAVTTMPADLAAIAPAAPRSFASMAPIPNPPARPRGAGAGQAPRPAAAAGRTRSRARAATPVTGPPAIAAANTEARETSRRDAFVGGVQVFRYGPGRVYEVWTAPLRVTTLSLGPGETLVSKAAGDTVRWQIGETTSGQGPGQRAHVMIKPLERGLETNLVLATSQRVYLIQLRSGAPDTFNAAISWDLGAVLTPAPAPVAPQTVGGPAPMVAPAGPLDARYRIEARGRRPAWSPTAVMTDGVRTFLTFPPALAASEAPALFVIGPSGRAQMVNYRQQDGLWVVDQVFDRAELRVGDKHSQTVRITRDGGRL